PQNIPSPAVISQLMPRTPPSTLFPYTTLFRSIAPGTPGEDLALDVDAVELVAAQEAVQALHPHSRERGEVDLCPLLELDFQQCRSEEHTSELQSRSDLVCRLLLEKKKTRQRTT